MHQLANPARFLRYSRWLTLCAVLASVLLLPLGLYQVWHSPPDYQQGISVWIMYVHVPSAWLSMFAYGVMALGSLSFIVWRHPLGDVAAEASAPIGAIFTLITLVTGSLWGKPMWGTWWEWDARMTSVLLLFFLYVGYIAFRVGSDGSEGTRRIAAYIGIFGALNLPIIKFSVEWWSTLHQPASVLRLDGPTIHESMLTPLLVMAGAFFCLYLVALLVEMRVLLLSSKLRRQHYEKLGLQEAAERL